MRDYDFQQQEDFNDEPYDYDNPVSPVAHNFDANVAVLLLLLHN
jgi:hypothetical protein